MDLYKFNFITIAPLKQRRDRYKNRQKQINLDLPLFIKQLLSLGLSVRKTVGKKLRHSCNRPLPGQIHS